ncbi:hypothetical protein N7470_006481 [Penicillium chermesinum]|nr:hypothetical protein N7470_006481 [Penicillium chermesinum]
MNRHGANTRALEASFLILSAMGFTLLWPMMMYNGTLVSLLKAAWGGAFPDGRPLRTTYTGVFPLDYPLSILVAFFNDQVNGTNDGAWLLMLDLLATLQIASLWTLCEANRKVQSRSLLRLFVLWPLLWNMFGAAVILPIYFYVLIRSTDPKGTAAVFSTPHSQYLLPTATATAIVPALVMLFGYKFATDSVLHGIIASFQVSPLALLASGKILSKITSKDSAVALKSDSNEKGVLFTYLSGAILSAGAHLYTLFVTLHFSQRRGELQGHFHPIAVQCDCRKQKQHPQWGIALLTV